MTKEPVPQLQRQDISLNNNSKVSAQTFASPKQLGDTIRQGNRTDQSASVVKLRMCDTYNRTNIAVTVHECVCVCATCVHSDIKTTKPTITSRKKHFMKNVKECRDVNRQKYQNKVGMLSSHITHTLDPSIVRIVRAL